MRYRTGGILFSMLIPCALVMLAGSAPAAAWTAPGIDTARRPGGSQDRSTGEGASESDTLPAQTRAPALYYDIHFLTSDDCASGGIGHGNGYLEPGEDATIIFRGYNVGDSPATGLVGVLRTATPGVTLTQDTAGFPEIPVIGNEASSPFALNLSRSFPCGTRIDFVMDLADDQGNTWAIPFTHWVGAPGAGHESFANFDAVSTPDLPPDWLQADVEGTSLDAATAASSSLPPGVSPFSPPHMLVWNTGSAERFAENRVYLEAPVDLSSVIFCGFECMVYYHLGCYSNASWVQAQYSTDGGANWADLPSGRFHCWDGTVGWKYEFAYLSPLIGQPEVWLGLLCHADGVDDFFIDDVKIYYVDFACHTCLDCTLADCRITAGPAGGLVPLPVDFAGAVDATGCPDGTPVFHWDFGDGCSAIGQDVSHTYTEGGAWTATLTVSVADTSVECVSTAVIRADPYDWHFLDDRGRSRLCVNSRTSAFEWQVLAGPAAGVYPGVCQLAPQGGLLNFTTAVGLPYELRFRYQPSTGRADGVFVVPGLGLQSGLDDRNAADNPPGCD